MEKEIENIVLIRILWEGKYSVSKYLWTIIIETYIV